ncbi:MAG: uracil-DNA glycosylase [Pseudomonadota bacterium]
MQPAADPRELLDWYVFAGVDVALQDEPANHFAAQAVVEQPVAPPRKAEVRSARAAKTADAVVPNDEVIARAKDVAETAQTLADLREAMTSFEGCNLKATARSTVFSDGNPDAKIMVIGEAPGRDEDEQGLPFVGKSGQLLDKMFGAIGLDRTSIYITNILPWRPPGNRTPTPVEAAICKPFVDRHIALVAPDILVLVGGSSAKTMMQTQSGIMSVRGKLTEITLGDRSFPALPMLHPAYLLRQPAHKRHAWADLLTLQAWLAEHG